MLDLEDAVAENQKDAARFSLYHALKTIDYGGTEVIVRINGLDTPHCQEDIRVCVAGGREVYQGKNYMDGKYLQKAAPRTRRYETPRENKVVAVLDRDGPERAKKAAEDTRYEILMAP